MQIYGVILLKELLYVFGAVILSSVDLKASKLVAPGLDPNNNTYAFLINIIFFNWICIKIKIVDSKRADWKQNYKLLILECNRPDINIFTCFWKKTCICIKKDYVQNCTTRIILLWRHILCRPFMFDKSMYCRVANSLLSQELKLCFSDTKFTKAPYTKKILGFF